MDCGFPRGAGFKCGRLAGLCREKGKTPGKNFPGWGVRDRPDREGSVILHRRQQGVHFLLDLVHVGFS